MSSACSQRCGFPLKNENLMATLSMFSGSSHRSTYFVARAVPAQATGWRGSSERKKLYAKREGPTEVRMDVSECKAPHLQVGELVGLPYGAAVRGDGGGGGLGLLRGAHRLCHHLVQPRKQPRVLRAPACERMESWVRQAALEAGILTTFAADYAAYWLCDVVPAASQLHRESLPT